VGLVAPEFHAEARRAAEARRDRARPRSHDRLNADPKVLLLEVWMERDRARFLDLDPESSSLCASAPLRASA